VLADLAGVVAAGVEFAVVTTLCGADAGDPAMQPNNMSRVTWTVNSAFTDLHVKHPLIPKTITQLVRFDNFWDKALRHRDQPWDWRREIRCCCSRIETRRMYYLSPILDKRLERAEGSELDYTSNQLLPASLLAAKQ
jgi:hypothetical protein